MAYTLKTTGLATKLKSCVGVDEDGVTVKDFVTGNVAVQHASVAVPKTGSATWKGVARNWFKTDYGASVPETQGITWTTPPPAFVGATGLSFWCAANTMSGLASQTIWACADGNNTGLRFSATGNMEAYASGVFLATSTTAIPAATKVSFGLQMKLSASGLQFFRGLESGTLSADGTYNDPGAVGNQVLNSFGGRYGHGSVPGEYFIACWFEDAALITEAEMQSLHNDWFGTLFESVTATTQTNTTTLTLTANATQSASTFTNTTQTATTTLNLTAAATQSYNVTVRQVSTSPDALGHVFGGSAGTPWANLTGINWYWQDTFGGPIIDAGSGASTNASGVLTVNIPNTALANGARGYLSLQVPDVNPAATWPRMLLNLPVTVA